MSRPNTETKSLARLLYHRDGWKVARIARALRVSQKSVYLWLADDMLAAAEVAGAMRKLKAS